MKQLEAAFCALCNEIETTMPNDFGRIFNNASINGQIDIARIWSAHKFDDAARMRIVTYPMFGDKVEEASRMFDGKFRIANIGKKRSEK